MHRSLPQGRTGTYVLVLVSTTTARLAIGRQLRLDLVPGCYLYVGSAFGPGGVRARLDHHRRVSPRPHWHIDYLRAHTCLAEVWFSFDPVHREHQWAAVMMEAMPDSTPVPGFGASDCSCGSHLFHIDSRPSGGVFAGLVRSLYPDHHEIRFQEPIDNDQERSLPKLRSQP